MPAWRDAVLLGLGLEPVPYCVHIIHTIHDIDYF